MNLLYFLRGITKFTVQTNKQAKLINDLRCTIPLRAINKISENELEFCTYYSYTKKVRQHLESQKISITRVKSYGATYLLYKYRKRAGLFVSGVAVFLFLFVSQLFVWDIRVEGNEKIRDEDIVHTLSQIGFTEGVYKKSVNLDSLVNNFLIREKRISWIAINFDGGVAHVEVREGRNPVVFEKKQNVNLVASHDGIVMRADVLEGGSMVSKGDVVFKGQLLVSAFIDRKDKSSLRGARGSVWAMTQREISVYVPLNYIQKKYSGTSKINYVLNISGIELSLGTQRHSFELCSKNTETFKAVAGGKYPLPFRITKNTYNEYCLEKRVRSHEECVEIARKTAMEHLKKNTLSFTEAGRDESYEIQGETLVYRCIFTGVENIAKEKEFELSEDKF